ncbi:hypothetical protein NKOR_04795 [Candidatus Nitrosopumilus koreensis AR1]|uniref:Uncharacterized protein n=1 Tax=Candidatus Nitrosopumilus koreensis AR1 TaxID=1229908 RepID=K0B7B0_9ARCH|nr:MULTISPECIES: hypothetical protein [Nitrosopumilus]AFS80845.1 hypothetical protein NKOR_04795 [Candidatus Nitrosopumilus koreensis AR1]
MDSTLENNANQATAETGGNSDHPSLQYMESLIQESLQIYELENQRVNTLDELINSLKVITKFLGLSIELPSNILHLDENTNIKLLPNLNILVVDSNSKTEEKTMDSFSTDIIINILDYITPKIVELVRKDKLKLLNSINFLRSANNELKKIENIGQLELNQTPVI